MSTKGASNRYGNSRGSRKGHPTKHTGFAWAKDFNKYSAKSHFDSHKTTTDADTQAAYIAKSVRFANTIDRKNNVSYIRKNGQTVKFSKKTNEFVIVDKRGYVTTYYRPDDEYKYYLNDRRKNT